MLAALNTKPVGFIGILVALGELLLDQQFQGLLLAILPPAWVPYATHIIGLVGVIMAYYGMPHTAGASPPSPPKEGV